MENNSPLPCPNTVTVRKNPHRRARPTPSTNRPKTSAPSLCSSSSTPPQIPSFPIQEILAIEMPQNFKEEDPSILSTSSQAPLTENLKVYLRIKPLLNSKSSKKCDSVGDQNQRPRDKYAWPKNPAKKNGAREKNVTKKTSEVCVIVNDSQSVTVSLPLALQESKRIRSEVYEGFSHVFSPESSQAEVYESMVSPFVDDFLKGKSGMLAALGPSGSGKTHTIFGCPREPGMIPLALQHIFKQTDGSADKNFRSFYLSIFEIYSERSKGEKICDLSEDASELTMQQSTIKGLQEVLISDARQAESLIARAMLKRVTAATNTNSNSSRSQCIINIRNVAINPDGVDVKSNNAVLTIVDLAGAEREKRTGNQGARLLESNFINNTSMVFGLCLKSLFEHQKNPKKPLQKHFQYSLLTKYLRDYLEGKKRMALILTVKPGEEDYLDTTYLLRQASPYMKIKFNNVEKASNMPCNKRQMQSFFISEEQSKRMKLSDLEACPVEGESAVNEYILAQKDDPEITKNQPPNLDRAEFVEKERNQLVMPLIAKSLWHFLNQYRGKLEIAELGIQHLRAKLKKERTRNFELEKQLENLKRSCTFSVENYTESDSVKVDEGYQSEVGLDGHASNDLDKVELSPQVKIFQHNRSPTKCGSSPKQDLDVLSQVRRSINDLVNASGVSAKKSEQKEIQTRAVECSNQTRDIILVNGSNTVKDSKRLGVEDECPNVNLRELVASSSQPCLLGRADSCSTVELDQLLEEEDGALEDLPLPSTEDAAYRKRCNLVDMPNSERAVEDSCKQLNPEKLDRDFHALYIDEGFETPVDVGSTEESNIVDVHVDTSFKVETPKSATCVASTGECNAADVRSCETKVASCKPEKPKRRLLPASRLLNDLTMHVEDEVDKPKGNRVGKKFGIDNTNRTQGSISLLRLLKSDLHL